MKSKKTLLSRFTLGVFGLFAATTIQAQDLGFIKNEYIPSSQTFRVTAGRWDATTGQQTSTIYQSIRNFSLGLASANANANGDYLVLENGYPNRSLLVVNPQFNEKHRMVLEPLAPTTYPLKWDFYGQDKVLYVQGRMTAGGNFFEVYTFPLNADVEKPTLIYSAVSDFRYEVAFDGSNVVYETLENNLVSIRKINLATGTNSALAQGIPLSLSLDLVGNPLGGYTTITARTGGGTSAAYGISTLTPGIVSVFNSAPGETYYPHFFKQHALIGANTSNSTHTTRIHNFAARTVADYPTHALCFPALPPSCSYTVSE